MPEHTTDQLLTEIRGEMLAWEKAEVRSAEEARAAIAFTEAFTALDDKLRHGASLPRAWGTASTPFAELVTELRDEIRRQLASQQRLQNELDAYQGRTVYFALDRDLDDLMNQLRADSSVQSGAIVRATDTGREFELDRHGLNLGIWRARNPA